MDSSLNNQRKVITVHIEKLEVDARKSLIIIDDREWHDQPAAEFLATELKNAGCGRKPHVLVQVNLVSNLFKMLRGKFPDFNRESGLCVFPGRSAGLVRKQAGWQDFYVGQRFALDTFVSVHACRMFDERNNPLVTVGEILPERTVCPEIRNVIVIDDVISSGATCRKLHERNSHKFPRAVWHASACVSRVEKIKGYRGVITPILVPPDVSGLKVPINSLTTLMDEKDTVGVSYAAKHCLRPDIFLAALATIKSEYGCNPERVDMHLIPWRDCPEDADVGL